MEFWEDELGLMEELYDMYKSIDNSDLIRKVLHEARDEINNILQQAISEVEEIMPM